MNSIQAYFHTDWAAMTLNDWIGTILTVGIFIAMAVAYFQVFRPKNREKLESRRFIPFDVDKEERGENDGGK